jgi:CubicO group peptidase (beta-lactamase class C family)
MREGIVRGIGLALAVGYAAFIGGLYVSQPQTAAEVTGGISASIGSYRVNLQALEDGLQLFGRDEFAAARTAFARADPARQDARTQFYLAYSYYRQGWGRLYQDDALFAQGLEALDRAIAVAPGGRIVVDDPDLQMHTGDELKAALEAGLRRDVSDFNPFRILRPRK